MGGTPSFELTFFGMERSVPDCLIRLIRDLEQGIISEAEFEPYKVRGAVCYAVDVLMGKRWAWEGEFRDSWGYSSAKREAYSRYAGLRLAEGGEDPSGI